MKTKLPVILLGLLCGGLICLAQDSPPPPPDPSPGNVAETPAKVEPPAPAQPEPPAKPDAPPKTEAPAPAAPATPPNPDEVVPLIVIEEAPLTDVIRNLARQSGLNFQFDPRVTATNQPTITLRFEKVTPQEALTAVLENYGLALVKDPKTRIARITVKDPKAEEPLFVKVIELKYGDPTNLVDEVKSTLSPRSKVLADARTRQLIVTTTEKEVDGLMTLIEKLDSPTRQVLIEARIMETSKNPTTIKGIDWAGTLEAQNFSFGNNTAQPDPASSINPVNLNMLPGIPRIISSTAHGGLVPATAFLNADGVKAVLSFLNKDSDTEVLATPRAVTLDNQLAQLSVTRAFPIFQITPGSANSPAGAAIQYTNLGTILSVTPRIAADNNVSLKVVPEVSDIDSKDQQTINGAVNIANVYAVRRIETHVMIPSGHTLVMGGLINDSSTKAYTKVPLMGDLPLIGIAFRWQSKQRKKQNLMIFVTPTIVQADDFHVTSSGEDYLKTQFQEQPEVKENAWDSAKPHDWTKPVE